MNRTASLSASRPDSALPGALEPRAVWAPFADLCRIPRPSKHEDAVRAHVQRWAEGLGLASEVDAAGNLIVRKPATPGCEAVPTLSLQGHLDMVTQKNSDSPHDFLRDPIRTVLREDGWLQAPETTLGADNGLGVALIMALLADGTLPHGPLEALFTVDEEAGMGGAHGLAAGALQGRLMLNLDTEEWGEFYLGCAGGADVDVVRQGTPEPLPPGYALWSVALSGLRGGHSGVNIHEGRGNAIVELVRVVLDLAELPGHASATPLRLVSLQGGNARNAIPREARAVVAVPAEGALAQALRMPATRAAIEARLRRIEPGAQCAFAPVAASELPASPQVLDLASQALWLHTLHAAPYGVHRMSQDVPGVVETSNNIGVLDLTPAEGRVNFMVRSLLSAGTQELASHLRSLWALSGTPVVVSGEYPGWQPNPQSPLLARCQRVFRQLYAEDSQVQVIHAGLECGILADKHPGMDIVSFGPTIRGAHAPGEAVEVASVARCWDLLRAIVSDLAQVHRDQAA